MSLINSIRVLFNRIADLYELGDDSHEGIGKFSRHTINQPQIGIMQFHPRLDGVTNDHSAFEAAVAVAESSGGGQIIVPHDAVIGWQSLSPIELPSNTIIDFNNSTVNILGVGISSMFEISRENTHDVYITNLHVNERVVSYDKTGGLHGRAILHVRVPGQAPTERVGVIRSGIKGDNKSVVYTSAVMRLESPVDYMLLEECYADHAGNVLRMVAPKGVQFGTVRSARIIKPRSEFCSRPMLVLAGEMHDTQITDLFFNQFQSNVSPQHPILPGNLDGDWYYGTEVKGGVMRGTPGIAARPGIANGACGDMIPHRRCTGWHTHGLEIHDFNEFGFTVIEGAAGVRIQRNEFYGGDATAVVLGFNGGAEIVANSVTENHIYNVGKDVLGDLLDHSKAAVRVWNAKSSIIGQNVIKNTDIAINAQRSRNTYLQGDTLVNVAIDLQHTYDASFNRSGMFQKRERATAIVLPGTDIDRLVSLTSSANFDGSESTLVYSVLAETSTRPQSDLYLLGAASNRLRISIKPTGQVYVRVHSSAGVLHNTTKKVLPATTSQIWLRGVFDGSVGTLDAQYSSSSAREHSDVTDWQSLGSATFAKGTRLSSLFGSALSVMFGHKDGVTKGKGARFKLLASCGLADGTIRWNFDGQLLQDSRANGFRDGHGVVWEEVGTLRTEDVNR